MDIFARAVTWGCRPTALRHHDTSSYGGMYKSKTGRNCSSHGGHGRRLKGQNERLYTLLAGSKADYDFGGSSTRDNFLMECLCGTRYYIPTRVLFTSGGWLDSRGQAINEKKCLRRTFN
jgi:hypothetical protein